VPDVSACERTTARPRPLVSSVGQKPAIAHDNTCGRRNEKHDGEPHREPERANAPCLMTGTPSADRPETSADRRSVMDGRRRCAPRARRERNPRTHRIDGRNVRRSRRRPRVPNGCAVHERHRRDDHTSPGRRRRARYARCSAACMGHRDGVAHAWARGERLLEGGSPRPHRKPPERRVPATAGISSSTAAGRTKARGSG